MMATTVVWVTMALAVAGAGEPVRQPTDRKVAALVSALSGTASADQPRRIQLKLFDWVRSGGTVHVPRGSTLTLVLSNGTRFELTGPARATVSTDALSATSGSIRALSALPRLPRVAPITNRKEEGRHSAAVRVRGPRINDLYPSNGAAIPVASTVFTFDAVDGATQYSVEVEDARAIRVFEVQTTETRVALPITLQPGAVYYWRVRTVGRVGAQARGEAEFRTLAAADEEARQALRDALGKHGDPHALALLAHIDYELGLLREAREGVRAALETKPVDPAVRAALLQLARRLEIP